MTFIFDEESGSVGEDDAPPSAAPPPPRHPAEEPFVEEEGGGQNRSLHRSQHSQGMESSILRFKNVNYLVGKKGQEKNILTDVSGTVRWGRKYIGDLATLRGRIVPFPVALTSSVSLHM